MKKCVFTDPLVVTCGLTESFVYEAGDAECVFSHARLKRKWFIAKCFSFYQVNKYLSRNERERMARETYSSYLHIKITDRKYGISLHVFNIIIGLGVVRVNCMLYSKNTTFKYQLYSRKDEKTTKIISQLQSVIGMPHAAQYMNMYVSTLLTFVMIFDVYLKFDY